MKTAWSSSRRPGGFWHMVGLLAAVLRRTAVQMGRGKQLHPTKQKKRKRRSGTLTGFFDMP